MEVREERRFPRGCTLAEPEMDARQQLGLLQPPRIPRVVELAQRAGHSELEQLVLGWRQQEFGARGSG